MDKMQKKMAEDAEKIAAAAGIPVSRDRRSTLLYRQDRSPWDIFDPQGDMNDAFEAAEKTGLFSETFWRTLGMDELGETWAVFEQDGHVKKSITDNYTTPALAVCAAILELKENQ
jgi:hypothetical protein